MTDKEKIKFWTKGRLFEIMNGIGENDAKKILTDLLSFIDSMQKEPKFKVGDKVRYKYNNICTKPRIIAKICGLSHYVDTDNHRMDMAYTDANFELVEESDTSVWHSKNEEPLEDKQVLIDINGFCFVDFYHKKDKRFYMFQHPRHYLYEIDKWAYVDDLLTLSNLETTKEPKKCMYSKDDYTDEDRKVICDGCEEECKYSHSVNVPFDSKNYELIEATYYIPKGMCAIIEDDKVIIKKK